MTGAVPESNSLAADSLTQSLAELQARGHFTGFSVAIVSEDDVLYQKGFGFADAKTQKAYTANTVQNIASISKTLIGLSLVKAQEMGKLKLDDPINDDLPYDIVNPHFPDEPITIWHLATHTSSIVDTEVYEHESYIISNQQHDPTNRNQMTPVNFKPFAEKITMDEFLQKVLEQKGAWYSSDGFLKKRPGTYFEYTKIGATLAAQVIAYATGETFADFSTQYILEPLGMTSSGWSFDAIPFD